MTTTALRLTHLQVESAQECLPAQVDVAAGHAGLGGPQPDGQRALPAGQVVDLQADQRALDDGKFAGVVDPGRAGGQPRVDAVPGHGLRGAVSVGDLHRFRVGLAPCVGLGEAELLAVLRRAPALRVGRGVLLECGCRSSHDAVRAHPAEDLDGQAGKEVGHAWGVVAGVEDDQDVRIAGLPLALLDQVGHDAADLGRGDLGDVVVGAEADRVQQLAPGGAAGLQGGDERVRPAGDELVTGATRASVDVAEQPVGAARGVRTQPVGHVDREDEPVVGGLGLRQHRQRTAQPGRVDTAAVQGVIEGAVTAAVFGQQRQIDRRGHRPVLAEQRVRDLEQGVTAPGQARVQVFPEV